MVMGADGGVGSTYNFMCPLLKRMLKNTAAGKILEAREDQYRCQQTCKIMYKYGKQIKKTSKWGNYGGVTY